MDKDNELKEMIITKINNYIKINNENKKNEKYLLKDFNDIKIRPLSSMVTMFYHPMYKDKDFHYLNEEETTDFLFFEQNCVFVDYNDELYNFHKIDASEKLLMVDLDNQEIKDNNNEASGDVEEEITSKTDLIALNYFPISPSHSTLTICSDQHYPQILSNEFLSQALQIFVFTKNNTLRLGFNSLGGGALINHLHLEMIFLDEISLYKLPIEISKANLIFMSNFDYKNENEIKMYEGVSVKVSSLDYHVFCWKIEIFRTTNDEIFSLEDSISHVVDTILAILLEKEVPHNLLVSNEGRTIYVIPRKFHQSELVFNTCWNDICGLPTFKEEEKFKNFEESDFIEILQNNVSVSKEEFEEFSKMIIEKFESVYQIEK